MTRYPNGRCEAHRNVRTSEPVCLVCMQKELDAFRAEGSADYVAAWNRFKASEQFRQWSNGATIHLPPDMQKYLENRILAAFEHGWNALLAEGKTGSEVTK